MQRIAALHTVVTRSVFVFVSTILLAGCGQTVKLYPGPERPWDEVTLRVPVNTVKLKVDGKPIAWTRQERGWTNAEVLAGACRVEVKMLPGPHKIEWSWTYDNISFTYYGSGTLEAKRGKQYEICFDYLPGERTTHSVSHDVITYLVNIKDYATWIEEWYSGEVVLGEKPEWANAMH